MKNFKMGNQLFKTLGTLKDKDKTLVEFEQDSKNKQQIDEYLKKLGLDKSFVDKELNLSKKANNVPLLQRIFGKQGMKINKEIHNSAKVLILRKGTKLIEEAERKKSEAASRGTPRNTISSAGQTPRIDLTGSPASALINPLRIEESNIDISETLNLWTMFLTLFQDQNQGSISPLSNLRTSSV